MHDSPAPTGLCAIDGWTPHNPRRTIRDASEALDAGGMSVPRPERPLDPDAGPLSDFAADLRRLREKAGNPAYRALSGKAHYSWSTLADAAAGRKLPSLAVTLAYVRACEGDPAEWETRWRETSAALAGPPGERGAHEPDELCPYVGLRAFRPTEADNFFGRENLTEELFSRVIADPFLAVFGASGSGKSSLLRAGLLPRITARNWPVLVFAPGAHPLEQTAVRLAAWCGGSATALYRDLTTDPRALHLTVLQELPDRPEDLAMVLVVDQFEEVFTLCEDRDERSAFLAALLTAVRAAGGRIRVVLGVRADFYPHCSEYPELVDALRDHQLLVGPMSTEELRRAISLPAARAGCTVEGALLARVVGDVAGQANKGLPLVSHALRQTWARRRGTTLTVAGYEAAGGIQHALAQTAEQVYTGLPAEQQRLVRGVFLRLVALGEGTEDTKRRVGRHEFAAELEPVLEVLAAARLITVDTGTVEIAHEALLRAWPRLHDWIDADRAGLRVQQQLTDDAATWHRDARDSSLLYRGNRLALAREWAGRHPDAVAGDPRAAEFLTVSGRHERSARRRRSALVAVVCVLALLAAGAGALAVQQNNTAQAKSNGLAGAQAAAGAHQIAGSDVSLAAQLDLVSYASQRTAQTETDLLSAENQALSTPLGGFTDTVYGVAYSADGRTLTSADRDGTVRLWNLADRAHPMPWGEPVAGHASRIFALALRPDGKTFATAGDDGAVQLWNAADPARPKPWGAPVPGHAGFVDSVAFSRDGNLLASGGADHTVRLWDVRDPAHPAAIGGPLTGATDAVFQVAISPDGRLLAAADHKGTVGLWDITDPAHRAALGRIPVERQHAYALAFSPDGRLLATGGDDFVVRLWNLADPARPAEVGKPLAGHTNTVYALAFDPAGTVLASAGADRTVRLWNMTDPADPVPLGPPLTGHTGYVRALAFSPDGKSLASGDADRSVRVWSLPDTVMLGHAGMVEGVAFAPRGTVLASAGADRTVRLWDTTDPAHPRPLGRPLTGHTGPVLRVAFSPDGRTLASASADGTVRLWNVADPAAATPLGRPLPGHPGPVEAAVFSPDGRVLATAGDDGLVRLWDVTHPAEPVALGHPLAGQAKSVFWLAFGHDGHLLASASADDTVALWDLTDLRVPKRVASLPVQVSGAFGAAFSPDDRTLAVAGSDSTVRLWDVHDPSRPAEEGQPLTGHTSFVYWVGFDRDGRTLAGAGGDGTVWLWDVTDLSRPAARGRLTGHTAAVDNAAFSPDGQVLATAGDDHTIVLTVLNAPAAEARICAASAGNLTAAQWQRYVPGLAFAPPCR
jgi:WD40 repeat protein